MKRLVTLWLPVTLALFFLSIFVHKGIGKIWGNIPAVISNEEITNEYIYRALKEPLIETIMHNGATLGVDSENKSNGQLFIYTFSGYMTDLPYRIILSRNVQFEDCAGCIGDWQIGMFSSPERNDSTISLREFIIQMVHAKNQNWSAGSSTVWLWQTSGLIWKVASIDGQSGYLIEVTSSSNKKWKIII